MALIKQRLEGSDFNGTDLTCGMEDITWCVEGRDLTWRVYGRNKTREGFGLTKNGRIGRDGTRKGSSLTGGGEDLTWRDEGRIWPEASRRRIWLDWSRELSDLTCWVQDLNLRLEGVGGWEWYLVEGRIWPMTVGGSHLKCGGKGSDLRVNGWICSDGWRRGSDLTEQGKNLTWRLQ